jgi:predicted dehydrogenase
MQDKVRVGFIGAGGIARRHVRDLLAIPDAEIVGFVDVNVASIAGIKEQFPEVRDVPEYISYKDMLEQGNLDAVEIHTPHTLHFQQAMDSLDAGLHVMLEKPMVCKTTHAQELIAKAEQKERSVVLAYQRHYQSQYKYIRQVVTGGQLGQITFVSALQCQAWKHGTAGTWRQIPEL